MSKELTVSEAISQLEARLAHWKRHSGVISTSLGEGDLSGDSLPASNLDAVKGEWLRRSAHADVRYQTTSGTQPGVVDFIAVNGRGDRLTVHVKVS